MSQEEGADPAREPVSVEAIPLSERGPWTRALNGLAHGFAHSWESCSACAQTSGHATYLWLAHAGSAWAAAPVSERNIGGAVDVYSPYGLSGACGTLAPSQVTRAWRAWAEGHSYVATYMLDHPSFGGLLAEEARRRRRGTVYRIDLRPPPETRLRLLHANRRRDLALAATLDLVGGEEARAFFVTNFASCYRGRGAGRAYELSGATLAALLAADNTLLLAAAAAGRIVSASLFGWTAHEGHYLYNVETEASRGAATRLIWEASARLAEGGVPWLNLGGGIRPGDGVENFKQRFGGEARPLFDVCWVHDEVRFAAACATAGVEPSVEGFFPPYQR